VDASTRFRRTIKISVVGDRDRVVCATRRLDAAAVPAARALVSQLDRIRLNGGLIEEAADVGEPLFRTLDAIHLTSAPSIRNELTAFVAYDSRICHRRYARHVDSTRSAWLARSINETELQGRGSLHCSVLAVTISERCG
jgi:hypothetical protein